MANVIKLKRGTSTPTTSDIVSGEVALDTSAKKLFVNDGGTVKEIGGGGISSDANGNTTAGSEAGDNSGFSSTFYGYRAGKNVNSANSCVAVGTEAMRDLNNGGQNVGVGESALKNNENGANNIGIGTHTLSQGDAISNNTAIGHNTLKQCTDSQNVGVGYFAGQAITSGGANCCVGYIAGADITSGSDNTILGPNAGDTLTTGSNNLILGHDALASAVGVSNEITFGDTNITKLRVPALSFEITASAVTNGGAFYENAKTVAADYTLSGSNAMAAGPITINSSVTVTISSGDTLTIV
tara:strand:- start:708 stop:1601 length:894 start_codon:yes stop_codon:yes gene_type:complete